MATTLDYAPLGGDRHRHGETVDPSIKRSREGLRAVGLSLAVLGVTALAQMLIALCLRLEIAPDPSVSRAVT
jgi:hypothetical protein